MVPSGLISLLAAAILLHTALLIPPSKLSHSSLAAIFLPLIILCNFYSWRQNLGAFAALQALWSTVLLLFRNPREDFQLINYGHDPSATKDNFSKNRVREEQENKDSKGQGGNEDGEVDEVEHRQPWRQPYPLELGPRFGWVTKLVLSFRFIRWDTGDGETHSFPRINTFASRRSFLLQRVLTSMLLFLMMDAVSAFQQHDPYINGQSGIDSPLSINLFPPWSVIVSPRIVRLLMIGMHSYCTFSIVASLHAVVCVCLGGLGLVDEFWGGYRPEDWPPLFGRLSTLPRRGLTGFWGTFWHQLFRQIFVDPGKALTRFLGIPRTSTTGYIIQIAIAFFLSGVLHALTLPVSIPELRPLRYAAFFWINGSGVICDVLGSKALGFDHRSPAMFGYLRLSWAGIVLYLSGPLLTDEIMKILVRLQSIPSPQIFRRWY